MNHHFYYIRYLFFFIFFFLFHFLFSFFLFPDICTHIHTHFLKKSPLHTSPIYSPPFFKNKQQ